jgi:hypothetical protein
LPLNCGKLLRERKREKMSNVEELQFLRGFKVDCTLR